MSAQQLDFIKNGNAGSALEIGATFSYQLIWQSENPSGSGLFVANNLTGYLAKMQIRKDYKSPVILELSTANTRITFDAPNGVINLIVPANVTAMMTPGTYLYDLDLEDANGFVTRFIQGRFQMLETMTVL